MRFFLLLAIAICCSGQTPSGYVFGFLRAHPQRTELPQAQVEEIQKGHMAHLGKMGREHKLVGAGPLGESKDIRGILIFRDTTLEEARAVASQDPAVLNKRLIVDLFEWPISETLGDKALAKMKEGPDAKWSMNMRSIVIYWRTAQWPADLGEPANKAVVEGHMKFQEKLRASGQIYVLGGLRGSKEFLGVAIYKSPDAAASLKVTDDDPFVQKGWVKPQAFPLYIADEVF